MIRKRSLVHVQDFTLYPEDLKVSIWYQPRKLLRQRNRFMLDAWEGFDKKVRPLIPMDVRWPFPITVRVIDVNSNISRTCNDWEILQAIIHHYSDRELKRLPAWQVLALYEAHRRGIIDLLLEKEDSTNTFFIGEGLSFFNVGIEKQDERYIEVTSGWSISADGMGDEQSFPFHRRIILGL